MKRWCVCVCVYTRVLQQRRQSMTLMCEWPRLIIFRVNLFVSSQVPLGLLTGSLHPKPSLLANYAAPCINVNSGLVDGEALCL